jgi:hypothetical protein
LVCLPLSRRLAEPVRLIFICASLGKSAHHGLCGGA